MHGIERLSEAQRWRLLLDAAVRAAEMVGWRLTRMRGRGRYSVYNAEKDGAVEKVCIRTTRDRLISFPPTDGGQNWKTLDDVNHVLVATVDSKANPRNVEVYMFSADDIRSRFNQAYRSRKRQGIFVEDNYGFWLDLDKRDGRGSYSAGSGVVDDLPKSRIATYQISELLTGAREQTQGYTVNTDETAHKTIGDVMAWARQQVAVLAGVDVESVKLDMKLEY